LLFATGVRYIDNCRRAVGGMRASIYDAMPVEGVKRLVEY